MALQWLFDLLASHAAKQLVGLVFFGFFVWWMAKNFARKGPNDYAVEFYLEGRKLLGKGELPGFPGIYMSADETDKAIAFFSRAIAVTQDDKVKVSRCSNVCSVLLQPAFYQHRALAYAKAGKGAGINDPYCCFRHEN